MIRIGETVIDPKRDLTPEQKESLRRIIESERIRQGLDPDGSDDNIAISKAEGRICMKKTEIQKPKMGPRKIVVTFFTFVYLVIIIFAPVNIPKLGIRFVPFYTIGENMKQYYSEGVGYIPSHVRELNVQVIIIEFVLVTILFAWSLYFFNNKDSYAVEK